MPIPTLAFGRTGHESTRLIFGGAALGSVSQEVADRTLEVLLRYGVNHIDVAASYGDAEIRIRPWLREHRDGFFLATKTGERRKEPAREELHRSLDRMGVDRIDLWQLHNLSDPIEWDVALSPGGAIEAAVQAREEGLIRFIGVTGHGSQIAATHRRSLERFDFDSVLLPLNYPVMQVPHYAANFDALVDTCRQRGIAVQTIKSIALRHWSGRDHVTTTWYEPLRAQDDVDLAVWWALGRPGVFVNTASDPALMEAMLNAATRFERRPDDAEMQALVERSHAQTLFV
jgi:aryl-alcohol dehydrogenase-like predicted oxidoreductase